jgi:hypothetical protein
MIMNQIDRRDSKFLGALVAEVAVSHEKMIGTAVDCTGNQARIGTVADQWSRGEWARNPDNAYPLKVDVVYNGA